MKATVRCLVLSVCALLLFPQALPADGQDQQKSEPDQRVKRALDAEGVKYQVTSLGNCRVAYKVSYSARVEADCQPVTLREAVRLVLLVADAAEKELTGKDEF